MSEEFEVPPMSGDNLPLKELKPKEMAEKPEERKNKRVPWLVILLIIIFSILLGVGIGLLIRKKNKQISLPSPSPATPKPSVFTSPSAKPQNLDEMINNFKKNLDEVDLKESSFNPPALDFDIRFKAED